MEASVVCCTVDSSYVVCKFIHKSADVPKYVASRYAVSAVIPRLSFTICEMRDLFEARWRVLEKLQASAPNMSLALGGPEFQRQ